ncbi:hypothetical protein Droror1_Dr00004438 [Drosera rotundifolia]
MIVAAALSRRLSDTYDDSSIDGSANSHSGAQSPESQKQAYSAAGIKVHEKKWTDGSVSLDALPGGLGKLGKQKHFLEETKFEGDVPPQQVKPKGRAAGTKKAPAKKVRQQITKEDVEDDEDMEPLRARLAFKSKASCLQPRFLS